MRPRLGIVLGTGFQHALERLNIDAKADYGQLPGFPQLIVGGQDAQLLTGRLGGTPVLVLTGRAHFYQGYSIHEVTFPVRVMAAYGITDLLLTNAAGGINPKFCPGDFMTIADHINLMGINPLRDAADEARASQLDYERNDEGQDSRFLDLSETYDKKLSALLVRAAGRCGVRMHAGVYLAVSGPSYETPAEIRAFRRLGADAVGMSTVPEAIVARQCNLRVAGLSCITNLAAGRSPRPLSHTEVLQTAERVKRTTARLVEKFGELYGA